MRLILIIAFCPPSARLPPPAVGRLRLSPYCFTSLSFRVFFNDIGIVCYLFTWGVEEFVIRPCLFSYAFKTYSPSLFCLRTRDQGKSDYTWAKMQLPSPSRDWMSVSTLVRFQSKGHIPWSFLTFYLLRALLLQLILLVSVVTYPHNCISLLIHYGPGYRSLRFLIYVPEAIEDNLFSRVTRRAPLRFLVLEIYRRWKVVLRLRGEESSRTDLAPRERCCLVKARRAKHVRYKSVFQRSNNTFYVVQLLLRCWTDTGSVNVVRDIRSSM